MISEGRRAERALVLSYAPATRCDALAALMAIDDRLGEIARRVREPMITQMRLIWWRDALIALDRSPPPAEPTLQSVARDILPHGVTGSTLAELVEGWGVLLGSQVAGADVDRFAMQRGVVWFRAAAAVLDARAPEADDVIGVAGAGWALAELAEHAADPLIGAVAKKKLDAALRRPWESKLRALGAMALLARFDLMEPSPPAGGPRRVARLAWHRLSGR